MEDKSKLKKLKISHSRLLAICDIKSGQKTVRRYYQSKFGFEVSIYIN